MIPEGLHTCIIYAFPVLNWQAVVDYLLGCIGAIFTYLKNN